MPTDRPIRNRVTAQDTSMLKKESRPVSALPLLPDVISSLHTHFTALHQNVMALEAKLAPIMHRRLGLDGCEGEKDDCPAPPIAPTVQSLQYMNDRILVLQGVVQEISNGLALE